MPYNLHLTDRIRTILETYPTIVEKKMFGGVGFMINGNLACGVQGEDMIVRVGVENNDASLAQPYVRPFMVMPGKPMAGWVLVAPEGTSTEQDLKKWVAAGVAYASTLPEK
jgi:TfoX/Sxy family transcriptional regulator of competence genes